MLGRKLQYQQTRRSDPDQFKSAEINQRSARLDAALRFRQQLAGMGTNQTVTICLACCQLHTLGGGCEGYAGDVKRAIGETIRSWANGVNQLTVFAEDMRNKNRMSQAQQIQAEQ
jgi:hypothetical protein